MFKFLAFLGLICEHKDCLLSPSPSPPPHVHVWCLLFNDRVSLIPRKSRIYHLAKDDLEILVLLPPHPEC